MQQESITLIVAALGIAGTIGGIVVGHLLTRTWQRKQWLMDQRANEFRELVVSLEDSLRAHLTNLLLIQELSRDEHLAIMERRRRFLTTIRTRIFTAEDMERLKADERWGEAIHSYERISDAEEFRSRYDSLMQDLVKAATKA